MKPHRMNPASLRFRKRCDSGQFHRIVFNRRGQLCLLDHSAADPRLEAAWLDLGGPTFACLAALRAWKKCMTTQRGLSNLPAALSPYAQDCFAEHKRREQLRRAVQASSWSQPAYQRATFLERILNELLTTRLGMPAYRWLTVKQAATGWLPLEVANPHPHQCGQLGVQHDWFDQVYRTGLAVIEGGLTVYLPKIYSPKHHRPLLQVVPERRSDGGYCFQRRRLVPFT